MFRKSLIALVAAFALAMPMGLATPAQANPPQANPPQSVAYHYAVYFRADAQQPWLFVASFDRQADADSAVSLLHSFGCDAYVARTQ